MPQGDSRGNEVCCVDHRNPYVGAQAVGEGVLGRLLAAIEGFTAVPDRFVDGGDHVIVLGRHGGSMKHSGATLDAAFCHVYWFDGSQIAAFQQFTDSAQWARLMPWLPKPGRALGRELSISNDDVRTKELGL